MAVEKTINYLHLVYIIIIFVIILLAIWLVAPYVVCEESLVKFEFAATITSIVLAVVSIIFSISSSQGISQNLGSMRDASDKIGNVGDKLETIRTNLTDDILHLSTIEQSMQDILHEVHDTKDMVQELGKNNFNKDVKATEQFVFAQTSIVGKCIIYACRLSFEQSKPFPASLIGHPAYVHGYITALETCAPSHFRASGKADGNISVSRFDDSFFELITKANINKEIRGNANYTEMNKVMQNISAFFEKA